MSKKEKPYCINCGNINHCKKTLKRTEREYIDTKLIREWTIEVCRKCHCARCETE